MASSDAHLRLHARIASHVGCAAGVLLGIGENSSWPATVVRIRAPEQVVCGPYLLRSTVAKVGVRIELNLLVILSEGRSYESCCEEPNVKYSLGDHNVLYLAQDLIGDRGPNCGSYCRTREINCQ